MTLFNPATISPSSFYYACLHWIINSEQMRRSVNRYRLIPNIQIVIVILYFILYLFPTCFIPSPLINPVYPFLLCFIPSPPSPYSINPSSQHFSNLVTLLVLCYYDVTFIPSCNILLYICICFHSTFDSSIQGYGSLSWVWGAGPVGCGACGQCQIFHFLSWSQRIKSGLRTVTDQIF